MTEQVFYFAGAFVVGIKDRHNYTVWLLDYSNDGKVQAYLDGNLAVPANELIDVNRSYTTSTPGPAGVVHFAEAFYEQLTVLGNDLPIGEGRGRVAIAKALWDKIPADAKPLPSAPCRDQDYRLRLVMRSVPGQIRARAADLAPSSLTSAFVGFHAVCVGQAGGLCQVIFFSWTDDVLGSAWVDLSDPVFDPLVNNHTTLDPANGVMQGALFVSMDAIFDQASASSPNLMFLRTPKVPRGAAE